MKWVGLLLPLLMVLTACTTSGLSETDVQTAVAETLAADSPTGPERTVTAPPPPSATPTETPSPSATLPPEETPAVTATSEAAVTPDYPSADGEVLVIDHTSVALFDQIPEDYIRAASEISVYHRHASVGANIDFGLDCLMNYFPDRGDPNDRPFACDRGLDPGEVVYGEIYDRSNWVFELHAPPPNPNPGWNNKVNYFIEAVDGFGPNEDYRYVGFNLGYVEGAGVNANYFSNDDPDDQFPSVLDLEALDARHPDTELVWWTMALARLSEPYMEDFNQQLREYVRNRDGILMDIADIESHLPDGTVCTGINRDQEPIDVVAVCDEYVEEVFAGHLNARGRLRMAKAFWVMMARLAGWDPVGSGG
jgi:hypothetical protein